MDGNNGTGFTLRVIFEMGSDSLSSEDEEAIREIVRADGGGFQTEPYPIGADLFRTIIALPGGECVTTQVPTTGIFWSLGVEGGLLYLVEEKCAEEPAFPAPSTTP